MIRIGFLQSDPAPAESESQLRRAVAGGPRGGKACPRCGSTALVVAEGCLQCRDCGYSKCG